MASAPKQSQLRSAAEIEADVPTVKAGIEAAKTADAVAKTADAVAKAVIGTTIVPKKNQNLSHYV